MRQLQYFQWSLNDVVIFIVILFWVRLSICCTWLNLRLFRSLIFGSNGGQIDLAFFPICLVQAIPYCIYQLGSAWSLNDWMCPFLRGNCTFEHLYSSSFALKTTFIFLFLSFWRLTLVIDTFELLDLLSVLLGWSVSIRSA